jgi:hypothetical protein
MNANDFSLSSPPARAPVRASFGRALSALVESAAPLHLHMHVLDLCEIRADECGRPTEYLAEFSDQV